MKFGPLIKYNIFLGNKYLYQKKFFFWKIHRENMVRKLVSDHFMGFKKALYEVKS